MKKNKDADYQFRARLVDTVTKKKKDVDITIVGGRLLINIDGYGDKLTCDGDGEPVMLELNDGELRVVIWGDINKENPTEIISLEGSKESKRKD